MICDVHAKLHVRKSPGKALSANGCAPAQRSAPDIRRDFDGAVRSDDSPVTYVFSNSELERIFLTSNVFKVVSSKKLFFKIKKEKGRKEKERKEQGSTNEKEKEKSREGEENILLKNSKY